MFCRFEKMLIMSSILVFYFSLTLKLTHFSVIPKVISSVVSKIVEYIQHFNYSIVFNSQNGLL